MNCGIWMYLDKYCMIETNQNNKANVYLVSIKKASAVVLAK
jgi:hypothetical protein